MRLGAFDERDGAAVAARIFIDETPALTPTDLRARAPPHQARARLHLIVVTICSSCTCPERRRIGDRDRGNLAWLKALAKELACPVIALFAVESRRRAARTQAPVMSDLRESGSLEQDADMISSSIGRGVRQEHHQEGVAEMILPNTRKNGATANFQLTFQGEFKPLPQLQPRFLRRGPIEVSRLIRAVIDTEALRSNLRTLRRYAPGARVVAV